MPVSCPRRCLPRARWQLRKQKGGTTVSLIRIVGMAAVVSAGLVAAAPAQESAPPAQQPAPSAPAQQPPASPPAAAPAQQQPAARPAPPPFATTKVDGTDNVYIFRFGGHQAMFVVTPAGVIATDPISLRRQAAKTYIEEIQKITKAPIKYVIYSHSHYDH